jgi:hypothetical protein
MGVVEPAPPGSQPFNMNAVTTKTLQNAASTDGTGNDFDITGMATVAVTINPTSYTGTVTFKASQDGTNFDVILGTKMGATTVASSVANPGSTKSIWIFQTAGLCRFRAALTSSGGTSITVTAEASPQPNAVPVGSTLGTAVIQANSGQSTTATSDAQVAANMLEAVVGRFNGATVDRARTFTKMVLLDETSVTTDTPVDVLTPTAGKLFRVIAYHLTNDAATAGAIQIQSVSGTNLLVVPSGSPSPDLGPGVPADAINHHMFIDATQTGHISGWIGYNEE